jgi:hypothetical protein
MQQTESLKEAWNLLSLLVAGFHDRKSASTSADFAAAAIVDNTI